MTDVLLELAKNPNARRVIKALGLPLPLPQPLARGRGPWSARPLSDKRVAFAAAPGAELVAMVAECLAAAGADPLVDPAFFEAFRAPGETFGRPPRALDAMKDAHALVFDATGPFEVEKLRAVFDFFQPRIRQITRSGRVIILARPADHAASAALEGFVRSLAKEIGKTGATANLVRVEPGAEKRVAPVLRWLLSPRSAFVTAQPLVVSARAREIAEPPEVRPLEKKIALVTGAARGIGEATARALAAEGAHVICLDRPADDAATSRLARELGGTPLLVDMLDPDAPAKIAAIAREKGGIDVVVHNAGITRDKTLARMSPEQWDSVVGVNLAAVIKTTNALDPHLKDGARVVCLSSIAGLAGNVGQTAYAASKAGIVGFVRETAPRLAERGITVNAVAPGFIETRMTAAIPVAIREVARRLSALGQGGLPEDVASAITFLASPGAHGITGSVLRVCGGAFVGA